ncbi:hypothetical protein [Mesorhizobium sp.]|uniref:hypothetical protein n=1 Tax=Mesorhizobium sp. TaxID=1871066 RepID=UPI00257EFACB|nr:hypothetical protein [Mesorhizobium sp.]
MYKPFEARIREWLKDIDPARFEEKNIRMVQRLVKVWRMQMAGWSSSTGLDHELARTTCRRDGR